MSPTEHDLRAALSDGEGGRPDPDRLIALGRARQARRRVQLISTAAVVAVVAGGGAGIVALVRGGGGDSKSSAAAAGKAQSNRDQRAAARSALAPAAANSAAAGAKAATSAVACPTTLPRYALPGGGSPGQFGADEPLFSKPVKSMVVCSYAVPPGAAGTGATLPHRTSLTGARAARLAASLNEASPKPAAPCPRRDVSATARNYAIVGVAADGTALPTVTVTRSASGCADSQVTNGTAVRYNWAPPSDLLPVLATPTSPPKMHGSPISS